MKNAVLMSLLCLLCAPVAHAQIRVAPPAIAPSAVPTHTPPVRHAPLVVGWHDEMNDPHLWFLSGPDNPPDVYAEHVGALTLRLPHVPEGYPYAYQWSGVTRTVSADLGRYPVLMARVSCLDAGSYAHLDVEERDVTGRAVRTWRSPTLTQPGLTFIDMGRERDGSVRRLTLRLIVGGKLEGAKCEYDWIRFVRRADVAYLQEVPALQSVTSTEPLNDVPALAQFATGAKQR